MKTYRIWISFILVLTAACSPGKRIPNRYYLIEIPSSNAKEKEGDIELRMNGSCEISRVDVAPAYERNQIANRSDTHEISYYRYHLWAMRPSVSVKELILRDFEISETFSVVSERFSLSIPDYLFMTRIDQLEVLEDKNSFSAHLSVRFTLLNNHTRDVILMHEAEQIVPLAEKDLNLFAGEISRILLGELKLFRMKLAENIVNQED